MEYLRELLQKHYKNGDISVKAYLDVLNYVSEIELETLKTSLCLENANDLVRKYRDKIKKLEEEKRG